MDDQEETKMILTGILATPIATCLQQGSFTSAFQCFGQSEIGMFLVPFLLVFAIIYGILNQVDVVGGRAAGLISLALSLLIAFQVRSMKLLAGLVQNISLPFVVIIVGIMLAWVIYGMFKPEIGDDKIGGNSNISLGTIVFFIIVIAMIFFFGSSVLGGFGGGLSSGAGFLSGNMMVILIGLILIIVIAWVLSGES